jgi:hypothetical protein
MFRTLSVLPCAASLLERPRPTPKFPVGTQFHVYTDGGYILVKQKGVYLHTLKRGEHSYPDSPLFLSSRGFRSFREFIASLPTETTIRVEAPTNEVAAAISVGNAYGSWISENVLKPVRV